MKGPAIWLVVLVGLLVGETGRGAPPRTAVLDFERAGVAGSLEPGLADLSRAVQAELLASPDGVWVERQELDRLLQEAGRAGLGANDPATAVRLGGLLQADLVLRGEIAAEENRGTLKLEVIDLKRADLLAARTEPVTIGAGKRLAPTAQEIAAAVAAARAALAEGRTALEKTASLRVIAPLYFKNISRTERLDFAAERLAAALDAAAGPGQGLHVLHFPQSTAAGAEAGLVLGGLTDANPDAWQHVADAYVWATVEEKPVEGAAFETVPVTISLQVWNGGGAPVESRWEGPAAQLDQGVAQVVAAGLAGLKTAPARLTRDPAERDRVADEMWKRSQEITQRLQGSQFSAGATARGISREDFLRSEEGRKLLAYRRQLAEIALFLKPLNKELKERVYWMSPERGAAGRGRVDASSLSATWAQVRALQARASTAARKADGSLDEPFAQQQAGAVEALRAAAYDAPVLRWYRDGPELTPVEVRDQRRQIALLWFEQWDQLNRAYAGQPPPAWLLELNGRWISTFRRLNYWVGPVRAREILERTWPWLKPAIGRELRKPRDGRGTEGGQDAVQLVFGIYDAFGNNERAIALLDEAWRAYTPEKSATPVKAAVVPAKAKPEFAWVQPASAGPELAATIREIEPWPKAILRQQPGSPRGPLEKVPARLVDSLAWHQGRLWIAESATVFLPPALGLENIQGDHYLWAYDPALRQAELMTPRLQSHSTVRTLLSQGDDLWLGFDGAGVWRWNPAGGELRRFKGDDGLVTPRINAAAARPDALLFLGGNSEQSLVARYDLATGAWSGMTELPRAGAAMMGKVRPRDLAVWRDWVGVAEGEPRFFSPETKTWRRLLPVLPMPPGVAFSETPRFYASVISADAEGFWLGRENMVRFLQPEDPDHQRTLDVPGYPTAFAHSGRWLWMLLEREAPKSQAAVGPDTASPTRLGLVDKRTFTYVGSVALPGRNLRKLAVADGRVWAAGAEIFELKVTLPEEPLPGAPTLLKDFPLHRAAWAGDPAALEKALAAGAAANQAAAGGWTPLMAAVAAGRIDLVQRLLAAKADPNARTAAGASVLEIAVEQGDHRLVEILLAAGAQAEPPAPPAVEFLARDVVSILPAGTLPPPRGVDAQAARASALAALSPQAAPAPARPDWTQAAGVLADPALVAYRTPLQAAVAREAVELVTLLLDHGARVDTPDRCGRTALFLAVQQGKPGIARALLARGANAAQPAADGATPVLAAYRRHEDEALLRDLLASLQGEARRQAATQALFQAVRQGALPDLALLHSLGADLNAATEFGETPLSVAVAARRPEVALWLNAQGVKVSAAPSGTKLAADSVGELVDNLMRTGDAATLEKLLATGLLTVDRNELLIGAVRANQPDIVRLLLAQGADPAKPGADQKRAIDYAQDDAMRTLLGADVTAPAWPRPSSDSYRLGATINRRARITSGGNDPGVLVPEKEIPAADARLLQACAAGDLARARAAVAEGAALDCRDTDGMTPLTHALKRPAPALAHWLVEQGAALDYPTNAAKFPLTFAVQARSPELVDFLLAAGADVNAGGSGLNALMAAVQENQAHLMEQLLAAGADPNLCGGGDRSLRTNPLAEALLDGNAPLAQRLLERGANPRASFETFANSRTDEQSRHREPSLLMLAARGGNVVLLQRMISLGQDPRYKTLQGEDALVWATYSGQVDAVKFLLPLSALSGKALETAAERNQPEIAALLRAAGYQ